MNNLEKQLLPIAQKWAGNIPIWEAKKQGIDPSAIRHWAHNNPNVIHPERGIYTWLDPNLDINWENNETARQIAQGGEQAYLWGPSVLELMEIGEAGGPITYIAVPKRRRDRAHIQWVVADHSKVNVYANLPVQDLEDAVLASIPMLDERKTYSVFDAVENKYPEKIPFIQQVEQAMKSPSFARQHGLLCVAAYRRADGTIVRSHTRKR